MTTTFFREGIVLATVLAFLAALSRYHYLLFHTVVELFTICVALSVVMIVVNSQRYVKNSFFTFLGISYGFAAIFDFAHTLAYSGMQIFPEYGTDLAPQMWLIARYLEAGAMVAAFLFIKRHVRTDWLVGCYAVLSLLLLLSVFQWRVFPASFIDGQGLTPFKIWSEYILVATMLLSVYLLRTNRSEFHPDVLRLLLGTYLLTIGTELSFTFYVDMYGFSNLIGHLFKGVAYYCLYRAVIQNSLREPYKTLFFEIDQTNHALSQEINERKKADIELRESEERYRALMMQSRDAIFLLDLETLEGVEANPKFEQMTRYHLSKETPVHVFDIIDDSQIHVMQSLDELHVTGSLPPAVQKIKTKDGRTVLVERTASLIKVGTCNYQLTTLRDVTKEMERQRGMQRDIALAAQVQRALLPTVPRSKYFHIETLFRPRSFVSGDMYHWEWRDDDKVLRGYLIDITGHGLATALQTAAVNVLLHEVMDLPSSMSVSEQLSWLNQRIPQYIDEASFVAAIAFEVDFSVGELRYAAAGITDFLFNAMRISCHGLFLGINDNEPYETKKIPFSAGDSVCFMTDGISDVLTSEQAWDKIQVREICRLFNDEPYTDKIKDDVTAICITTIDQARVS